MIKRYEPMGPNRALLEHPRGRWVRHETFEMFKALMKRLEAELGEARVDRERLTKELKEACVNYEEVLQSRVHAEDDSDFHAAEAERLRSENERLRSDRDDRRADAIYGAAYVAAPVSLTPRQAHAYAADIVSIWRERAAQKGGDDG